MHNEVHNSTFQKMQFSNLISTYVASHFDYTSFWLYLIEPLFVHNSSGFVLISNTVL